MGERTSGKAFGAKTLRLMPRSSELLNKVWGLEGCPSKGQTMRKNRSVRLGFSGSTVLVVCRGDQVSFNTTEGGGVGIAK